MSKGQSYSFIKITPKAIDSLLDISYTHFYTNRTQQNSLVLNSLISRKIVMNNHVRVRFAPSPTGIMHLGNIRAAYLNFLYARQKQGVFILRVEDTDAERNFDLGAKEIINDLNWLGISYDEGPYLPGMNYSYFQSERGPLYAEKLRALQEMKKVYRCFCSAELLEKKRERQRALKQAPRYDQACLALSAEEIQKKLDSKTPFIWRFQISKNQTVVINDLGHGTVTFDMNNFSDFPLTRQDDSFTFIFANFVDDWLMNITHVFRGEDHLSNTANQALLYQAFEVPLPVFWHLPIIINHEGKKLSKRDFGFSLRDLQVEGFLPEAIANYLATIGKSYKEEIMNVDELIATINFDGGQTAGQVRYDVEKLRWMNHQWINRIPLDDLLHRVKPFLNQAYPNHEFSDYFLSHALELIKAELTTLHDAISALNFCFVAPTPGLGLEKNPQTEKITAIITNKMNLFEQTNLFLGEVKKAAQQEQIQLPALFSFMRLVLMGTTKGPSIAQIVEILGTKESRERIIRGLELFKMK